MANATIISKGLFGRLSVIEAPRPDVLARISRVSKKIGVKEAPKDTFAKALPLLLIELNGLVETIVFGDSIAYFAGYDFRYINKLCIKDRAVFPLDFQPDGWGYTQVWSDEANRLMFRTFDSLKANPVSSTEPKLFDAETALRLPDLASAFDITDHVISEDMINYASIIDLEDWRNPVSKEAEIAGWQKLKEFVDRRLGPDWVAYRTAVDITESWPDGMATRPNKGSSEAEETERRVWLFKLSLYAELRAALERGTTAVSNFATGNYYHLLTGQEHPAVHLHEVVARGYAAVLQEKLERVGFLNLDLAIPPVLRMCLSESKTVGNVIDKAIQLRQHRWFVKLRKHLAELSEEKRPEKLIRYLGRLREHIELGISGLGAMNIASLGVTSTGSISLSLPTLGKQLLAWVNPVVYIHSRISKSLTAHDSIGDLARILDIHRSEVILLLRKVDLLGSSRRKLGYDNKV